MPEPEPDLEILKVFDETGTVTVTELRGAEINVAEPPVCESG